jgi:hypothetical protein
MEGIGTPSRHLARSVLAPRGVSGWRGGPGRRTRSRWMTLWRESARDRLGKRQRFVWARANPLEAFWEGHEGATRFCSSSNEPLHRREVVLRHVCGAHLRDCNPCCCGHSRCDAGDHRRHTRECSSQPARSPGEAAQCKQIASAMGSTATRALSKGPVTTAGRHRVSAGQWHAASVVYAWSPRPCKNQRTSSLDASPSTSSLGSSQSLRFASCDPTDATDK